MMQFTAAQIDEYMDLAINESAGCGDDVPVGCVIVDNAGNVISRGRNTRERDNCLTGHAEINALLAAANLTGSYKLSGCTLFVTLEPCPMCAGAINDANIDTVIFGAENSSCGACGSVTNVLKGRTECFGGIKRDEISKTLSSFFMDMRAKKE